MALLVGYGSVLTLGSPHPPPTPTKCYTAAAGRSIGGMQAIWLAVTTRRCVPAVCLGVADGIALAVTAPLGWTKCNLTKPPLRSIARMCGSAVARGEAIQARAGVGSAHYLHPEKAYHTTVAIGVIVILRAPAFLSPL